MFLKRIWVLVFSACYMKVTLLNISQKASEKQCTGETETFTAKLWYDYDSNPYESIINGCVTSDNIISITLLSRVSVIGANTFVNLPKLHYIAMSDKGIRYLTPGFLKNTPNLGNFFASHNKLSVIKKDVFNGLTLNRLMLKSNEISFIEKRAFANLNVSVMNLSNNKLSEINGSWFHDSWIRKLDINSNQITTLYAHTFKSVKELKILQLQDNKIFLIEDNTFGDSILLQYLDLSWNTLNNIDFLNDTEINYIDLSFNLISSMDIDESMNIKEIVIYPNPWNCKCLMKFWKYAWTHELNYFYKKFRSTSTEDELKTLVICIVHGNCDNSYSDPEVLRKYFKLINYSKFKRA